MHIFTLSLLLLPMALAHRHPHGQGYDHKIHHRPLSGSLGSSGAPFPSATSNAPYGMGNTTTGLRRTGLATAVSAISSAIIPESLGLGGIGGADGVLTTSVEVNNNAGGADDSGVDALGSTTCDAGVATVTENPIVTVTVAPGQGSAAEVAISSSIVLPVSSESSVSKVFTGIAEALASTAPSVVERPSIKLASIPVSIPELTSTSLVEATLVSPSKTPSSSPPALQATTPSPTSTAQAEETKVSATPVSSSTAPENTSTSPSSAGGCRGKRGIIATAGGTPQTYDQGNISLAYANSPNICWIANWYSAPPPAWNAAKEFVPQDYGISSSESEWHTNAKQAIAAGAKTFLSFGEPEAEGRDHLEPEQAVDLYTRLMQPYADDVKLCSPSVLQPRESMDWLAEFLTLCEARGCTIDMVCVHWFDTTSAATPGFPEFKRTVENATALAKGKKVWVDNFQANGSPEDVQAFLEEALPYLEGNEDVERYAYVPPLRTDPCKKCEGFRKDQFIDPNLESNGTLTDLGRFYADFKVGA